eukprot:sb/3475799/
MPALTLNGRLIWSREWNREWSREMSDDHVIDSSDTERLTIAKDELYKMLKHEDLKKSSLLIYANKQDIKDCMSSTQISQTLNLKSIKDHPYHIQPCCALSGEGPIWPNYHPIRYQLYTIGSQS